MNKTKQINLIVLSLIIGLSAFLLVTSVYIVQETQQAVITQFGKPVGKPVITPGIKFKLSFIQQVHLFDRRFLEWDGAPNQIPTKDKRFIWPWFGSSEGYYGVFKQNVRGSPWYI